MKITKSKLRQIIQEELEIDEVFGLGKKQEEPEKALTLVNQNSIQELIDFLTELKPIARSVKA